MTDRSELNQHDLSWWLRAGWIARGVSYFGAGMLAFGLAAGFVPLQGDTTQKGALTLIGDLPLGQGLLLVLAVGLLMFSSWELSTIAQGERSTPLDLIDHIGKAIGICFYASLAWSAVRAAAGSVGESGTLVERLSRVVLSYPLGRIVMIGAGAVVALIALRRLARVWTRDFDDSLVVDEMGEDHRRLVLSLGQAGEIGRSLSFLLVGFFLAVAGFQDQSSEARGLDRALRSVAGDGYGRLAIGVVALGFLAYGLFCAVSSPARRLPDDR